MAHDGRGPGWPLPATFHPGDRLAIYLPAPDIVEAFDNLDRRYVAWAALSTGHVVRSEPLTGLAAALGVPGNGVQKDDDGNV